MVVLNQNMYVKRQCLIFTFFFLVGAGEGGGVSIYVLCDKTLSRIAEKLTPDYKYTETPVTHSYVALQVCYH